MLNPSSLKYLKDLRKNNEKAWFDANRDQYDLAKSDFTKLITELIKGISVFDKGVADLEAKHCMFRINRDIRFSKNKTPYKNNLAGYFNKAGKKGPGAGYYLHIQPGASYAAGGIWNPEANVLTKIRQEIDYNFNDWLKLINIKTFKTYFTGLSDQDTLQRPPKGYDINNPAIQFLKMKNYIVSTTFTDKQVTDQNFAGEILKTFKAMKPLVDFINQAIE